MPEDEDGPIRADFARLTVLFNKITEIDGLDQPTILQKHVKGTFALTDANNGAKLLNGVLVL